MARLMIGLCVGWIVYFLLQMAYMTQHISLTLQYLSLRSLYTYTFKKFKPFPGFNYRWVPMMHFFFPRRRKKENRSRKIRKKCYTPLGSFPLCIFFFPQPPHTSISHFSQLTPNELQMEKPAWWKTNWSVNNNSVQQGFDHQLTGISFTCIFPLVYCSLESYPQYKLR